MKADRSKSDDSTRSLSRRRFLKTAAAAGTAATFGAPAILRARNLNEKLNIAVIGCGGRGGSNLRSVSSENIVALCDVNQQNLNRAAAKHPNARKAVDFRKLYDHANEFDAVVVSTCEHTHAFATLPALQTGKHVYCEKPLTHGIWEARVIREAAAKAKVATQMGTQIHAGNNYRRVVELIQSGAIGPVREAHVWVSRAWGWQPSEEEARRHRDIVFVQDRPTESQPVTRTTVSQRLLPWPEVVSLVGFRQRDDVGPRQPLDRSLVLGAQSRSSADDRSGRTVTTPGTRARFDASEIRIRPARRHAGGRAHLVSGDKQAGDLDRG